MGFNRNSVVLVLMGVCVQAFGEFRIWENTNGRTVEAELVSVSQEKVTLKNRKGKQFVLHVSSLSASDQDFLNTPKPPAVDMDVDLREVKKELHTSISIEVKVQPEDPKDVNRRLKYIYVIVGKSLVNGSRVVMDQFEQGFKLKDKGAPLRSNTVCSFDQVPKCGLYPEQYVNYEGYLCTIIDEEGRIASVEASEALYKQHAEKLIHVKRGQVLTDQFEVDPSIPPVSVVEILSAGFALSEGAWQMWFDPRDRTFAVNKELSAEAFFSGGSSGCKFTSTQSLQGDFKLKAEFRGGYWIGLFSAEGKPGSFYFSPEDLERHLLEIKREGSTIKFRVDGRSVRCLTPNGVDLDKDDDLAFGGRVSNHGQC